MTDAPDGPTEGEPERGTRRSARVGDSGSPVGSTLSIVLAVVAVIAGFLILRAITDDNGDDAGDLSPGTEATAESTLVTGIPGVTEPSGSALTPTSTTPVRTGATVVVANASGVGGSAGAMSTALQTAGYTMGTAGNSTGEQLATSVVYYAVGDVAAQAVATSVAADMGGLTIAEMPAPPPIDSGLGTATVLVMLGTDTANKTLADLNPASVAPPAAAGVTTTT
jgi:LytR cell envelope-related transcriptional attenuator